MRAGFIIGTPGIVSIPELAALMPRDIQPVNFSILIENATAAGVQQYWEGLDYVLAQVATAVPACATQPTVIASLTGELSGPRTMRERMESRLGVPAIVAAEAMKDALIAAGMERPLIVSPYDEALRGRLEAYLRDQGLDPILGKGPQIESAAAINDLPVGDARTWLTRLFDEHKKSKIDGLVISGGGWHSLDLIGATQDDFGLELITSNTAIIWTLARTLEVPYNAPERLGVLGPLVGSQ